MRTNIDNTTDYCGNAIYRGDTLSMLLTEEGYVTFANDSTPVYHYYIRDHLGSIRVVFDQDGTVEQLNQYYPDGTLFGKQSKNGTVQPYKFRGKELQRDAGLDEYDFGARWMDPTVGGRFTTMDPMCEKYYGISLYVYCGGDPVNAVDPDRRSTYVINLGNGKYTVMGGNLYDNDLNIYVYTKDKDGEYTIRGESIGKTPLMSSLYNSDANQGKGSWAKGSIIDVNDMSGINFIQDVKGNDVSLLTYIANAFNNHKYDFKATNGTDAKIYDVEDYYRGMPIKMENGEILYTSARDIGNMMAGYKAGASGLNWADVANAFDLYQSINDGKKMKEGFSTRNAEMYGFMIGHHKLANRGKDKILNFMTLIGSLSSH